ncbi:MAG: hypothetical protein N3D15_01520 [Syntrophorhabdaceae bacterium]|nr:hypothetical protein [Syntrophorhabdaceae bacterium]
MENKRFEACERIRSLFEDAYKDRLNEEDARFWDSHLKYCNRCFDEYKGFVDKKEKGAIRIFMGYLSDFVEMAKEYAIAYTTPVLEGKVKKDLPLNIGHAQNISKGGMDITLVQDKKGKIKAYLSSERYSTSGVTISLAHRTKKGYITFAQGITNKKGIADLGLIKPMGDGGTQKRCAIILTDVIEK